MVSIFAISGEFIVNMLLVLTRNWRSLHKKRWINAFYRVTQFFIGCDFKYFSFQLFFSIFVFLSKKGFGFGFSFTDRPPLSKAEVVWLTSIPEAIYRVHENEFSPQSRKYVQTHLPIIHLCCFEAKKITQKPPLLYSHKTTGIEIYSFNFKELIYRCVFSKKALIKCLKCDQEKQYNNTAIITN